MIEITYDANIFWDEVAVRVNGSWLVSQWALWN